MKKVFGLLMILSIVLVSGCTSRELGEGVEDNDEEIIEFFKEYSIVLNNINEASLIRRLSSENQDLGVELSYTEDYVYEDVEYYFDGSKEQAIEAKEILLKTEIKLNELNDTVPNEFFIKEIENRKEQVKYKKNLCDNTYSLAEYFRQVVYEVNYGSENKVDDFLKKYDNVVEEYNDNLVKLGEVEERIDVQWDQDWYEKSAADMDLITSYDNVAIL